MINKKILLFTISSLLILLASCEQKVNPYVYHQPEDHTDGWEIEDLSKLGIDPTKLGNMMDNIQDGGYENLHSILLVKDGKLVFEEYFQGYSWYTKQDVASVTKSVTSALIGIAIEKGYIAGSDQILSELLPEYADLINDDPNKKSLKLKHILTMTSGIEWDEETYPYGHPQNDCERMQSSGDMVAYALERPVVNEPGTHFQYSCANTMLLSVIIKTQTGINADEFAEKYVFQPLGITDYRWETYTGGLSHTDGGLHLRPRDMAKIGLLYLKDGRWDGQQVIPKAWVDESTRAHIPVILNAEYGFQWWMAETPVGFQNVRTYFASGFGGQRIYV